MSWISEAEPDLSDIERDFIDASVELRDREQQRLRRTNRRLRRQLTAASLAAVLALVATVIAVTQQRTTSRQRQDAVLALLSSTAADLATSQVGVASLLAVEAERLRPGAGSLGALEATLRTQPAVLRTIYPDFLKAGGELVATSADSGVVAFLTGDQLTIVGTADLQVRVQVPVHDVTDVALSPSGQRVAVATDHQIDAYDNGGAKIGKPIVLDAGESLARGGMAWTDEKSLFITPTAGDSRLVDTKSGNTVRRWTGERARFAVAAPGFFASVGVGSTIIEHREPTDATVQLVSFRAFTSLDNASGARYSPDGSWLAVDTSDGAILFQRQQPSGSLQQIFDLFGQASVPGRGVFSPDGKQFVIVSTTGHVSVLDMTATAATLSKEADVVDASGGFYAPSQSEFFVTAGDHLSELALDDREPLATATFGSPYDTPATLRSDGHKAVSFDVVDDHTSAWDPDAALPVGEASNLSDNVPYFYTSAGDQRWGVDFTTGTAVLEDDDGRVVQRSNWKVDTDPTAMAAADPQFHVYGMAHSDGTGLVLHDTSTLAAIPMLAKFGPARDSTFVVSRDLSMVARASRGATEDSSTIEVVEVQSGAEVTPPVHLRNGQSTITKLDFSPDGRHLLFGDVSGHIGELDVRSGAVDYDTFFGANGSVLWLKFTPDGNHVVAALGSLSLVWWDTRSHEIVGSPVVGAAPPDVVFSDTFFVWAVPDNTYRYVLLAVKDGMRRWNFDFASWPSIACERAGRNLTHAEWSRYMPADERYHVTCPQFPVPTD